MCVIIYQYTEYNVKGFDMQLFGRSRKKKIMKLFLTPRGVNNWAWNFNERMQNTIYTVKIRLFIINIVQCKAL